MLIFYFYASGIFKLRNNPNCFLCFSHLIFPETQMLQTALSSLNPINKRNANKFNFNTESPHFIDDIIYLYRAYKKCLKGKHIIPKYFLV